MTIQQTVGSIGASEFAIMACFGILIVSAAPEAANRWLRKSCGWFLHRVFQLFVDKVIELVLLVVLAVASSLGWTSLLVEFVMPVLR
jgi:hypothetical protein